MKKMNQLTPTFPVKAISLIFLTIISMGLMFSASAEERTVPSNPREAGLSIDFKDWNVVAAEKLAVHKQSEARDEIVLAMASLPDQPFAGLPPASILVSAVSKQRFSGGPVDYLEILKERLDTLAGFGGDFRTTLSGDTQKGMVGSFEAVAQRFSFSPEPALPTQLFVYAFETDRLIILIYTTSYSQEQRESIRRVLSTVGPI